MAEVSSHWAIELRSCCKRVESCWVLMLRYRMQSSAKRRIVLLLASSGRSLIYIKNSMGPRTVPWGTPERTGWEEDCIRSETTLCDLPCKFFLNPGMCGSSDAVPVELIL